jgi:hypothetical protein
VPRWLSATVVALGAVGVLGWPVLAAVHHLLGQPERFSVTVGTMTWESLWDIGLTLYMWALPAAAAGLVALGAWALPPVQRAWLRAVKVVGTLVVMAAAATVVSVASSLLGLFLLSSLLGGPPPLGG